MGGIAGSDPKLLTLINVLVTKEMPFIATAGVGFVNQVIAQFTDFSTGPPVPYAATVSWGDGSAPDAGTTIISDGSSNGFLVRGSHNYPTDATNTIQVSIVKNGDVTPASATSAAVVLTPSQSSQLVSFAIATSHPGNPVVVATAAGISAVLTGASTDPTAPSTLFVASYAANPTGVPSSGLAFYDVRVTNARDGSLLVAFQYPAGAQNPTLSYFNPATQSFQPVQSSVLVNDTVQRALIVVINGASVPALAALNHTVFTISIVLPTVPNTTNVAPVLVSAGQTIPASIPATFTGSGQLTLTLTPLQQSQVTLSQSALTGGGGGSDGQFDLPFQWVWDLIGLDRLWQMFHSSPKGGAPGPEEESDRDEAGPQAAGSLDDQALIRYWTELPAVTAPRELSPFAADPAIDSLAPASMAYLGIFFAGVTSLHDRKRRPVA